MISPDPAGVPAAAPAGWPGAQLTFLTGPLAIAGGLLMLATATIVVVSVTMRWLTSNSVQGDIELVQIATALAIFSFLPLCQGHRGNIMVDTFTAWLPKRAQAALDGLWDLVYAGMAALIAWRLTVGAYDTIRSRTVSMMLGLPVGWAIAACAAMAALLAVVAVITAWVLLRKRR
jgi:TRAP-type C4-dicarboxylate transport system permease small subunit